MNSTDKIWHQVLEYLNKSVNPADFETWIKPINLSSITESTFTLSVPNSLYRDWIISNNIQQIKQIIRDITGNDLRVLFHVEGDNQISARVVEKEDVSAKPVETFIDLGLNPKYTFSNFVVGNCNRFAHAASLAVAESPASAYNPLFLYGGVGLGKTHLICAIGNHLFNNTDLKKISYLSTEKFLNEFITAVKENLRHDFQNRYRNVDVLLIDDIQFISGKEATQEEFFHTFNTLYENGKQIIITSDRPPHNIPMLEERLRSRFQLGLITDLQPPDLETRIAILQKISAKHSSSIPESVMLYLAENIHSNIRVLEGALTKLIAYSSLMNQAITIDMTQNLLRDTIDMGNKSQRISLEHILESVSSFFDLKVNDLISKKRNAEIVLPRHIAMYLCRELTNYTTVVIGNHFGGKDHTTVLHGIDRIKKKISKDPEFKETMEIITRKIKS